MHTTRRTLGVLRTAGPGVLAACLVLALVISGGGAWAVGKIGAKDIKKNAVRSKQIKNGAVKTRDLAAGAVTAGKVRANSLTGSEIDESTAQPTGPAGQPGRAYPNPTIGTGKVTSACRTTLTGTDINSRPRPGTGLGEPPRPGTSSTAPSSHRPGHRPRDGTFTIEQACNAGDVLLSGGPANVNATSVMVESFPAPGSTNAWKARIKPTGADNFSVVVLCIDQ